MKSRFSKGRFTLFIILACIIFIGGIIYIISKHPQEYVGPMPDSELVLTKIWNGEVVSIPALLKVPQWMKETWAYRKILSKGNVTKLEWKDLEGNTYIASVFGREKDKKTGKSFVCFSSIIKKRPDSSLEETTLLAGDNDPIEGKIFDENGKKIMFISKGNNESYTVSFFEDNEDKFEKEWEINTELKIFSEQIHDPNGHYHFTYNMREYR